MEGSRRRAADASHHLARADIGALGGTFLPLLGQLLQRLPHPLVPHRLEGEDDAGEGADIARQVLQQRRVLAGGAEIDRRAVEAEVQAKIRSRLSSAAFQPTP